MEDFEASVETKDECCSGCKELNLVPGFDEFECYHTWICGLNGKAVLPLLDRCEDFEEKEF